MRGTLSIDGKMIEEDVRFLGITEEDGMQSFVRKVSTFWSELESAVAIYLLFMRKCPHLDEPLPKPAEFAQEFAKLK